MRADSQIMPFDMVGAAIGYPVNFRRNKSVILTELISVNSFGMDKFIRNLT